MIQAIPRIRFSAICTCLAALLMADGAVAASEQLVYTGTPFTTVRGVFSTDDFVSMTVTLDAPLVVGGNTPSGTVVASNGVLTVSGAIASGDYFGVNANGQIISWIVGISTVIAPSTSVVIAADYTGPGSFDYSEILAPNVSSGGASFSPGTWNIVNVASIPEPGVPSLMLAGLSAFAFSKRKRLGF